MAYLGQGVAFLGLVAGTTLLELHDKHTGGLWLLVVVWAIFAEWHPKKDS